MLRRLLLASVIAAAPRAARADDATAKQRYEAGVTAYNLGEFDKAVDLFRQAYEQMPEPAFLFNIAQAYRQAGDCKQALFFYKRFLSLKQDDTKKPITPEIQAEVESRIGELEACVRSELANKPPDQLDDGAVHAQAASPATPPATPPAATPPPKQPSPKAVAASTGDDDDDHAAHVDRDEAAPAAGEFHPQYVAAHVSVGAAKVTAGSLDAGVQPTLAVFAGYPLALGPIELELGPAFTYARAPYMATAGRENAQLFGVIADAAARYSIIPALGVRAEVGGGILAVSGSTAPGNPFTEAGATASGAVSTALVRAALTVDYAVLDNVVVLATPIAFSYSPAPSGYVSSIASLTELAFMLGVEYRK